MAATIMVAFLFIGEEILKLIGIDVNSFALAGAFVLFFLAIEMILGIVLYKGDEPKSASIVPIAFPLIAGAGTMTALLVLRAEFHVENIIVAIIINIKTMINFFRRIRKKLADDNKPLKYMRYALGEILLVVVGILIALTINNKNEARKTKQFEYEILLDISISMDENFASLNRCLNGSKKAIRSANIILQFLEENLPYHDSLDVHFSTSLEWCSLSLTNAGYESLKTYGRNLITNDTIRENLGVYDSGWIETLAQRQEDYFYNTASPVLIGLFEKVAMRTEMKPFNYEELKNSNSYISILKTSKAYREDQVYWYTEWQIFLTNTYELINRELKKK